MWNYSPTFFWDPITFQQVALEYQCCNLLENFQSNNYCMLWGNINISCFSKIRSSKCGIFQDFSWCSLLWMNLASMNIFTWSLKLNKVDTQTMAGSKFHISTTNIVTRGMIYYFWYSLLIIRNELCKYGILTWISGGVECWRCLAV